MNAYQKLTCAKYACGDYAHLATDPDWRAKLDNCGDSLFRFLMIELSDNEDCTDWTTAIMRAQRAADDLFDVVQWLRDAAAPATS